MQVKILIQSSKNRFYYLCLWKLNDQYDIALYVFFLFNAMTLHEFSKITLFIE